MTESILRLRHNPEWLAGLLQIGEAFAADGATIDPTSPLAVIDEAVSRAARTHKIELPSRQKPRGGAKPGAGRPRSRGAIRHPE